jgi:hypothetical protein
MIMKVAVPLPKHSPMFETLASSHTVFNVLAQDLLGLVETRGRAGLDANQSGFFKRISPYHLDGMLRDSLAATTSAWPAGCGFFPGSGLRGRLRVCSWCV